MSLDVGAWLSLVERLVRDQEAGGSNPLAPTKSPLQIGNLCACAVRGFPYLTCTRTLSQRNQKAFQPERAMDWRSKQGTMLPA